jgi:hypothetical protein
MEIWQCKIRALRKKIKGWSINVEAESKKKKQSLLEDFDKLDMLDKTGPLGEKKQSLLEDFDKLDMLDKTGPLGEDLAGSYIDSWINQGFLDYTERDRERRVCSTFGLGGG